MAFQDKKFLDAEGITHLVKLLDEYPNNQVLGSVIDAIEGELEQKAAKSEIPEVPVQDVQVNGTSVLQNGIANVPLASSNEFGVIKLGDTLSINAANKVNAKSSSSTVVKIGAASGSFITPEHQHEATFYGLAKAAGHNEKDSAESLGTYTDEAKTAIQNMLDVPSKSDIPEVPVHDVQVNGISVLQDGVANVPVASGTVYGVARVSGAMGVDIINGFLTMSSAESQYIQGGTHARKAITPKYQHESTFYGLAKAAGDTTQSQSSNSVGTYTAEAKAAIKTMLGVEEGLKVVRLI